MVVRLSLLSERGLEDHLIVVISEESDGMESDLKVSSSRARSSATFSLETPRESLPALISEVVRTSRRFKFKEATTAGAILTVGFTWRVWAGVIELSFTPGQGS